MGWLVVEQQRAPRPNHSPQRDQQESSLPSNAHPYIERISMHKPYEDDYSMTKPDGTTNSQHVLDEQITAICNNQLIYDVIIARQKCRTTSVVEKLVELTDADENDVPIASVARAGRNSVASTNNSRSPSTPSKPPSKSSRPATIAPSSTCPWKSAKSSDHS